MRNVDVGDVKHQRLHIREASTEWVCYKERDVRKSYTTNRWNQRFNDFAFRIIDILNVVAIDDTEFTVSMRYFYFKVINWFVIRFTNYNELQFALSVKPPVDNVFGLINNRIWHAAFSWHIDKHTAAALQQNLCQHIRIYFTELNHSRVVEVN